MEHLTTSQSNPVARNIARRMVEGAEELEHEEAGDDLSSFGDEEEHLFQLFAEEVDNPYDSDDPRSLGGEYFWHSPSARVTTFRRLADYSRLVLFHLVRFVGFVFLVLQHFFGLNRSRFQWAVDLAEKEQARQEREVLHRLQRQREHEQ